MSVIEIETKVDKLWTEFCKARERAWSSHDINDGIAASRAFGQFMRAFDQMPLPAGTGTNVVSIEAARK
jgi:hypothetical protein